jgi:hypothetical protein
MTLGHTLKESQEAQTAGYSHVQPRQEWGGEQFEFNISLSKDQLGSKF